MSLIQSPSLFCYCLSSITSSFNLNTNETVVCISASRRISNLEFQMVEQKKIISIIYEYGVKWIGMHVYGLAQIDQRFQYQFYFTCYTCAASRKNNGIKHFLINWEVLDDFLPLPLSLVWLRWKQMKYVLSSIDCKVVYDIKYCLCVYFMLIIINDINVLQINSRTSLRHIIFCVCARIFCRLIF